MKPRVVVIANPRSQGGSLGRHWASLASHIRRELPFEEALTQAPGDATRLARDAIRAGAEIVVAVGGDGTVNEVANGWYEHGVPVGGNAALAVLPYGTGGDFVRTIGVPKDFAKAIDILAAGHRQRMDLGRIDYVARDGEPGVRMFANIASFGMSGLTDRLVNQSKKRFGSLSFFGATARAMWQYDNQRVRLSFDDKPADGVDLTINTVAIANGRYFGGGMMVAPDAAIDDGELDVVCIGDMSMMDFILKSRRMYAGTHLTLPKVSHRRARVVRATPADPHQIVELDVDGETPGILPATFQIVPRAIDLIVPKPGRRA